MIKNPKPMHPGSVLNIIRTKSMTTYALSKEMGMDIDTVRDLLNGDLNINKTIAKKLAKVTSLSANTWLNMQKDYDRADRD